MAHQSIITAAIHRDTSTSILQDRLRRFAAWRQKRRDLAELRSLSGAALRDLAIDRTEVSSIVNACEGERRRNRK